MKKNTQTTLAEALQLSRTTVARALNNNPCVSESTRKMVMDKARELGYTQPSARKQIAESTREIALLAHINSLKTFFWIDVIHGLEQYLKAKDINLRLVLVDSEQINSGIFPPPSSFTGALCIAIIGDVPSSYFSSLWQMGFPVISYDIPIEIINTQPSFDVISLNNFEGVQFLTKRVIAKGYTKLAFAGCKESSASFFERYKGFEATMQNAGLEPIHIKSLEKIIAASSRVKKELFCDELGALDPDKRPEAYICANDTIAASIMEIKELYPDLVGDIICTGFDNTQPIASKLGGTVEPHTTDIGRLMGMQIYNRIENPELPHTILRLNVTPIFNDILK